ncbi:MAG TPA: cyclase family protein [Gemmatimonadaceae bacterium]|nr:cyclase family protein [Gemmatimonadaceae bacterium]
MIYDISQPLGARTAVWPGDPTLEMGWTLERRQGDSVNVAAVRLSVHAGTHADGPLHFRDAGPAIGNLPLDAYIGAARVIDARGRDLLDIDLLDAIEDLAKTPRLLFRTREAVDPESFPEAVAPIAPALARRLAEAKIRLVGTDAPSVDPLDSKTLEAHRALAAGGVAILENLVLTHVPPGEYTLVALPLRLVEADSSPVRAVLLTERLVPGGS